MKLSICIPTYNRSFYIDRLLGCVFKQIEKGNYQNEIEVLVSDNYSSDNTQEVVKKYDQNGVKYTRQSENIGPDRNFFSLFSAFNGDYIWLLGDDDLISDDAIGIIFQHISNDSLDYLYLRNKHKIEGKDLYLDGPKLFNRVLVNTTFMSSQIIKGTLIKENLDESKLYFGDLMAYYHLFLQCLHQSKKCLIPKERMIFMEEDNTGGYNLYKVWGKGVFDVIFKTEFKNKKKYINKFRVDMFYTILLPMTYKARFSNNNLKFNSLNRSEIEYIMSFYFSSLWEKKLLLMYLSSPKIVLFPITVLNRVVNKIRRIINATVF